MLSNAYPSCVVGFVAWQWQQLIAWVSDTQRRGYRKNPIAFPYGILLKIKLYKLIKFAIFIALPTILFTQTSGIPPILLKKPFRKPLIVITKNAWRKILHQSFSQNFYLVSLWQILYQLPTKLI